MSTTNPADVLAYSKAATDGPWTAITTGRANGDHWHVCDAGSSIASIHASDGEDEDSREPDATFIAQARTALPALAAFAQDVLALHSRIFTMLDDAICRECLGDWPCPTVQLAITHGIAVTK